MGRLDSDREDAGPGAGQRLRAALGRIFGDAENPLTWALPAYRLWNITVKLHLLFIIYVVGQMLWSIPRDNAGFLWTSLAMGALFVIVLLHEYGHCFACRAVNGEADEIILWPLGGLAMCAPPDTWKANLITVAGGPAVNVALIPVTSALLALTGHADAILFDPLRPVLTVGALGDWWAIALGWLHVINLYILGFNILLPMFPMDGGRLLHAAIWARHGKRRATDITTIVGFVTAGVVAVLAIMTEQTLLLAIAVFGGLICHRERTQMKMEQTAFAPSEAFLADSLRDEPEAREPAGPSKREQRRQQREEDEGRELDRILAKIAATGMDSLTRVEKRTLSKATERRRRQ